MHSTKARADDTTVLSMFYRYVSAQRRKISNRPNNLFIIQKRIYQCIRLCVWIIFFFFFIRSFATLCCDVAVLVRVRVCVFRCYWKTADVSVRYFIECICVQVAAGWVGWMLFVDEFELFGAYEFLQCTELNWF